MKVTVAAIPGYGHTYPMIPLALALQDAGHDVVFATGEQFVDTLPLPTVRAWTMDGGLSAVERETARRYPAADGIEFGTAMFGHVTAEAMAANLLPWFEERRPDLVISEVTNTGAAAAATLLGIPSVAFGIGQWSPFGAILQTRTADFLADLWTERGLPVPNGVGLISAMIDPLPPTWLSPDDDCPVPRMPIRTTAWSQGGVDPPAWLAEPRSATGRPRVYVTLGTVAFGAVEALRRAVLEVTAAGAEVLVSVGPMGDPAALGDIPETVHVERFVAQERVLPLVDLIVHHGGTGTVLGAFEAGVPQILMPQGADQFMNAGRMEAVGAGRAVPNDAPDGSIRAAVGGILDSGADHGERAAARRLADEVAAMPSPAAVVVELERLAGV